MRPSNRYSTNRFSKTSAQSRTKNKAILKHDSTNKFQVTVRTNDKKTTEGTNINSIFDIQTLYLIPTN